MPSTALAPKRHVPGPRFPTASSDRPAGPDVAQRILQALRQSPYSAHRQLCVVEDKGQIVLQGQVQSYFHKQMAQELARRCLPQVQIENRIEVCYRGF